MATTEKQTTYKPVSTMTLADLNRRNQTFHDSGGSDAGSMQPKEIQLEPGTTVHNSRGSRGKVIRVQGGRVVVKVNGVEEQWDLSKTYPAAETADAEVPRAPNSTTNVGPKAVISLGGNKAGTSKPVDVVHHWSQAHQRYMTVPGNDDSEATENLREATEEFVAEENQEPVHETGGAEAFGEALEELLDEEEREPEHQGDAISKRPWSPEDERLYQEQVVQPQPSTKEKVR